MEWRDVNKFLATAVVLLIGLCSTAHAAIVNVTEDTTFVPGSVNNPVAAFSSGVINYGVVGSNPSARSPFETVAGTPIQPQYSTLGYTAIQSGGSGTWNFGGSNTLSLLWGSPDSYNDVTFWSGANGTGSILGSLSGADLAAYIVAAGRGHDLVTILLDQLFGSVTLHSGGVAFEFANLTSGIAVVPIPAALPLFATGLGLMGLFGRRREHAYQGVPQ
jgi:hypothetical protein